MHGLKSGKRQQIYLSAFVANREKPNFFFNIYNLGISTQKIISATYILLPAQFKDTIDNFIIPKEVEDAFLINRYITKEVPIPIASLARNITMTRKLSDDIKKGVSYFFIYGIIKYINETDNTKRQYKFFIRFYNHHRMDLTL